MSDSDIKVVVVLVVAGGGIAGDLYRKRINYLVARANKTKLNFEPYPVKCIREPQIASSNLKRFQWIRCNFIRCNIYCANKIFNLCQLRELLKNILKSSAKKI